MSNKQIVVTAGLFMALGLSAGGLLFYKYNKAKPLLIEKKTGAKDAKSFDRMKVTLTVGGGGIAGVTVAIPYTQDQQVYELWKNYRRIKNDFIMQVQPDEMKVWIEKRDFQAIKGKILALVNDHLTKPVERVYLESFYCE